MKLFRLLWMGVFLAVLAGTGIGGGVASAQTQQEFFYTESLDADKQWLRVTDDERTNVNAEGLVRTYVDAAGDTQTAYNVPYIELTAVLQARSSGTTTYQEGGSHTMARGFTSVRHSIKIFPSPKEYIHWDCTGDLTLNTRGDSVTNIGANGSFDSFSSAFLPYARELTLVEDDDANTVAATIPASGKVCVAPEALDANPFYFAATGIGNANQGRGRSADVLGAYTPPTGWVIESSEIIYPADGATIEHTRLLYEQLPADTHALHLNIFLPGGAFNHLDIENAPTAARIAGPFTFTATYHADGTASGNGVGRISTSCTGGYDPNESRSDAIRNLDGLRLDNSWCTRSYIPLPDIATDLLPPSFDADVSGSAVAVTCALQVDGICRDVTSSADYVGDTILTGSTHDFVMKVHSTKPLSLLRLGINASGPGAPVGTSDVVVEMRVVEDYSTDAGYRITNLTYLNNGAEEILRNNEFSLVTNALDTITLPYDNVTLTSEPCSANQPEQCLVATISNVTFTAPFTQPVYSLTAMNTQAQQTTRYAR